MKKSYIIITMKTKTVSLPEELLEKGLELAKQDNRTFSGYVQSLIQRDADGKLLDKDQLKLELMGATKKKEAA